MKTLLLRWGYYRNFWKVRTAGNYKLSPRQALGLPQSKTQGRAATSTSIPVHLDSEQEVPISTDHTEQKTWSAWCRQCYRGTADWECSSGTLLLPRPPPPPSEMWPKERKKQEKGRMPATTWYTARSGHQSHMAIVVISCYRRTSVLYICLCVRMSVYMCVCWLLLF